MKKSIKSVDAKCPLCDVPISLHNTICGWENANIIYFPGENVVAASTSAEEKELRWLISKSPNAVELAAHFSNQPNFIKTEGDPYASRERLLEENYDLKEENERLREKVAELKEQM